MARVGIAVAVVITGTALSISCTPKMGVTPVTGYGADALTA
jgi:hypothetical protein